MGLSKFHRVNETVLMSLVRLEHIELLINHKIHRCYMDKSNVQNIL